MNELLKYFRQLILEAPLEFWTDANKYMRAVRDSKEVKRAIKLAELKTKTDRKKRYVLRDWNLKPVALTRKEIVLLKAKGILSPQVNAFYLEKEALYITK